MPRAKDHRALKKLDFKVVMTPANERTGWSVGAQLGIETVFADVLPRDKASYVQTPPERRTGTALFLRSGCRHPLV